MAHPLHFLCVTSALIGRPFMIEAARLGHKVWVLTGEKLLDKEWPRDILQDVFAVPKLADSASFEMVRKVISYLHRTTRFDRIVALTDWDVELVCRLREHLRIPGMGETTSHYFRDKLAMRMKAHEDGIRGPAFVPLFNWEEIHAFLDKVPPPWLVKPRFMSASMGVKKIHSREELWPELDKLGDGLSNRLLEQFTEGDVYHVDSVVSEREVPFAACSRYGTPMLDLTTAGGVFTTRLLQRGTPEEQALLEINRKVIKSLGLVRGVTHIEYIQGRDDGEFYFLEAAARVGAARIPDMIWHGTDICLWWEWARIEAQEDHSAYQLPPVRDGYAGVVATLSRLETPDLSGYTDPEICYRQARKHHAGLIVKSDSPERIAELLNAYAPRFARDFTAHKPYETRRR